MIESIVLASGLTLIVLPNPHVPIVNVDIIYEFDPSQVPDGVPHITEHLLYESSKSLANGEVDRLLRLAGGRSNASTSWDRIVISDTIASSNIELLLFLEHERAQHLCEGVTEVDLENQRAVIANELFSMTLQKNGELADRLRRKSFTTHPAISKEVMGQIYDLETASVGDVCEFAQRWLQPEYSTWIVSGDVSETFLQERLNELYTEKHQIEPIEVIPAVENEGHRWFEEGKEDRLTFVFAAPAIGTVEERVSNAMLYTLAKADSLTHFSAVQSIQAWSENRSYGGWMVVSLETENPQQAASEFKRWLLAPNVDWMEWQQRQRLLVEKYKLTNSGRLELLKNCHFALQNTKQKDCFEWQSNKHQAVPTQCVWDSTLKFWDLQEASVLWQGEDNFLEGESW